MRTPQSKRAAASGRLSSEESGGRVHLSNAVSGGEQVSGEHPGRGVLRGVGLGAAGAAGRLSVA